VFAYIVRRSFAGFIMLIVMSFVTYMLFFAGPIHPERYACGKNCSPAQQAQTKKALGYDKPAIVQWTDFLKGTVQGRTYPDDEALQKAAQNTKDATLGAEIKTLQAKVRELQG
jgi:peptide/nickel transport system permease protein